MEAEGVVWVAAGDDQNRGGGNGSFNCQESCLFGGGPGEWAVFVDEAVEGRHNLGVVLDVAAQIGGKGNFGALSALLGLAIPKPLEFWSRWERCHCRRFGDPRIRLSCGSIRTCFI